MKLHTKTLATGKKWLLASPVVTKTAIPLMAVAALAGAVGVANVANVTAAGTVGGAIESIITTWLPASLFAIAAYMFIKIVSLKIEQKPWTGYAIIFVFAIAIASSLVTNATNILTSVPL